MAENKSTTTKTSADDQVKFLMMCIKHTTAGRPNFDLVAKELTTPEKELTKGAAAKRYERLLKAHGLPLPSQQAKIAAAPSPNAKAAPAPKPSKNAKAEKGGDSTEDENGKPAAKKRKVAAAKQGKAAGVKKEDGEDGDGAAVKDEESE